MMIRYEYLIILSLMAFYGHNEIAFTNIPPSIGLFVSMHLAVQQFRISFRRFSFNNLTEFKCISIYRICQDCVPGIYIPYCM